MHEVEHLAAIAVEITADERLGHRSRLLPIRVESPHCRPEVPLDDLHVLVRNKRSPRLQRWFERNALSQTFELTNEAPG